MINRPQAYLCFLSRKVTSQFIRIYGDVPEIRNMDIHLAVPVWRYLTVVVGVTFSSVNVKVLVCWAKGKRLANPLPNPSLLTLSPPGTNRIL